jgi:hypothetical protein
MILSWTDATIQALQDLWYSFLSFIPSLIGAIIIFMIGWFIAIGVGRLITEILKKLKFNQVVERGGWKDALEKAEIKVDTSGFLGAIVKWILVIAFLLVSVEILGLVQFADFLEGILSYLPNVIIAVLIFVVTVIVVDIVEKLARAGTESIKVGYGQIVSIIVRWSIWAFAILAILHQLGIAKPFMETIFTGLVATLVISFGISFGLGGKEVAADILQNLRKKLKE